MSSYTVEERLERCGLPRDGKFGPFTITRGHSYYWIAEGPVPIKTAWEIWNDPLGRQDVRAAGHCGPVPPEAPWTTRLWEDGRKVIPTSEEPGLIRFRDAAFEEAYIFTDDLSKMREVVDLYHIDSDMGLRFFADKIKALTMADMYQPTPAPQQIVESA